MHMVRQEWYTVPRLHGEGRQYVQCLLHVLLFFAWLFRHGIVLLLCRVSPPRQRCPYVRRCFAVHGYLANAEEDPVQGSPIAKVNRHKFVWDVPAAEKKASASRQEQAGPDRSR